GATLYYALTGAVPFPGRGNLGVLRRKLHNDFVPPRRLIPSLPAQVEQAICRALDADPGRRPGSCREFADLLGEAPAERGGVAPGHVPVLEAPADERRAAPRYRSALAA